MGKWEEVKLKDVIRVINGRAYKKTELLRVGKYKVLRVGNLFTNNSWYYSDLELDENKYCDNGDLIYAWSASFGPRIWKGKKVIYHYHIWKMVCNEKVLDKEYAFHFLDWDKEMMKQEHSRGVGMFHLTKTAIENRVFPLPPLPEQKSIVAKLEGLFEKIDRVIGLLEENIAHTESLMGSVLDEEFGNKKPKHKLKEFDKIKAGGTPSRSNITFWKGTIPWLTSRELNTHYISESVEKITEEGLNNSSAKIFTKGTLLCGMYDTAAMKMSILKIDATCNQAIVGIKPNKDILNIEFLKYQLEFKRPEIMRSRRGVRQKNLNATMIKDLNIWVPNLKTQKIVIEKINKSNRLNKLLVKTQTQKLNHLIALKSSLLDQAFKGEL